MDCLLSNYFSSLDTVYIYIYRQSIGIDDDCVRDHLKRNSNTRKQSFCGVFSGGCKDYVEWQSSIDSGGNRILKGALVHVLPLYKLHTSSYSIIFN